MTFGEKFKKFWKEHWKEVAFVGSGLAVAGFACYKAYKSGDEGTDELEVIPEETYDSIEDRTAWNKDWDEMGCEMELITRQPHGPFRDGDFVDIYDGNCFIIAGPNSFYNEDPDTLEFIVLDNEGYYHYMPDDVHYA